jgi:hypothetical protein
VINLKVYKTISIETEDALKIDKAIKKGLASDISDFVQISIQEYFKKIKDDKYE